jgi:exopolysaccharide biosynthesis polyprenyl glycosylphosphotransferase
MTMVLHIVTLVDDTASCGGPVTVAINQCRALRERGVDAVLAGGWGGKGQPPDLVEGIPARLFPVHGLLPRRRLALLTSKGLQQWLRRNSRRIDAAHLHLARDLVPLLAGRLLRSRGVPLVAQTHGMVLPDSRLSVRAMDGLLTRRLLRAAAAVFSLTPDEDAALNRVVRDPAFRSQRLCNAIDPAEHPAETRADVREVLFLSRLHERKRVLTFAESARRLVLRGWRVRFAVVGPDAGDASSLRAFIARHDLDPWLAYEGPVPHHRAVERLAQAQVFALPSVEEPYPMVLLEALSLGLPSICTTSCGLAPALARADAAVVIEPTADALTDALEVLLCSASRRSELSAHALDAVHNQFSMPSVVDQLMDAYTVAQLPDRPDPRWNLKTATQHTGLELRGGMADTRPMRHQRIDEPALVFGSVEGGAGVGTRRGDPRTQTLSVPAQRAAASVAAPQAPAPAGAWERRLTTALIAVDAATLSLGVLAAYVIRFGLAHSQQGDDVVAVCLVPCWLLMLVVAHAYDGWRSGSAGEEARRVLTASLRTAGMISIASYGLQVHLSRVFLMLGVGLGGAAVLCGRVGVRVALHRLRDSGRCLHRVVVVGHPVDVAHLVQQAARAAGVGFQVVGACVPGDDERVALKNGAELPVLGPPASAGMACRAAGADVLAVASDAILNRAEMRRLAWELEGSDTRLLVAPRLTDVAGPRIRIHPLAGLPLLHVEQPRFSGFNRMVKGVLDRATAAVALVALAPLFAVLVVIIRVGSRGRALFRQQRVGLDGIPFTCWKLRSMFEDAGEQLERLRHLNEHQGILFKMRDAPRVTPMGRFLRRTSMDELPQLWNVLRGEMSLVGPRPPLPTEVDGYEQDVRRRLLVKPGLTGLWQVSGRADLSWEESVRLDLFYVENWSPALDLAILARTVLAVITRRGAY